jgi:ABC-type transport system involved in multi-copper enzyme maturation permease subunit
MVHVYLKNLKKTWLIGLIGPIFIVGFLATIAISWPMSSMREIILDRVQMMNEPIYRAILGDIALPLEFQAQYPWQAALFMYGAGTIQIIILVATIFIPARLLSTEIDKKALDIVLSFPIPRWRYLLEKFSVFLTYNVLYPIVLIATMIGTSIALNEEIEVTSVVFYAIGSWLILFSLGALSLLCATIFLDSSKSLAAAGGVVLGQYIFVSIGGLIEFLQDFQFLSLFNYFKVKTIVEEGFLPLGEVFIVVAVGIIALSAALYIFHKREFAL